MNLDPTPMDTVEFMRRKLEESFTREALEFYQVATALNPRLPCSRLSTIPQEDFSLLTQAEALKLSGLEKTFLKAAWRHGLLPRYSLNRSRRFFVRRSDLRRLMELLK